MKELSLHILDIAENSLTAGASLVEISLVEEAGLLTVVIRDNGRGIPPDILPTVADPFTTTRTTRPVGLGLPFWKMAAEQTGGRFSIESAVGVGTCVTAVFVSGHIDTPPVGDMPGTLVTLVQGHPQVDFLYTHRAGGVDFSLDTRTLRDTLADVPLDSPDVLVWLSEFLRENLAG
ncbi:MAG: sensor histidine kinase [Oscillospiraceae bacterium]|jgi:anti-sigma regulatory factor (Ser/Thr protein kinase)|nr:sensor histidine kinase [Oscillospiraceae bacterium]